MGFVLQVREHLMGMMGQAALMPATTVMKTSKLQMLQVYMFSAMFGYYLRRVDQRFQLAKSAGLLPEDPEDAVQRLERLFTLVRPPPRLVHNRKGTIVCGSLSAGSKKHVRAP